MVGRNGKPYSAYKANVDYSSLVFAAQAKSMATEVEPKRLMELNEQFVWFAPKGEQEADDTIVLRDVSDLRTIFGSNADLKIIASGVRESIQQTTLAVTPSVQRGFCRGRQLALNVVDADSFMRAFSVISVVLNSDFSNLGDISATPFYDFLQCFPDASPPVAFSGFEVSSSSCCFSLDYSLDVPKNICLFCRNWNGRVFVLGASWSQNRVSVELPAFSSWH